MKQARPGARELVTSVEKEGAGRRRRRRRMWWWKW
jgi:hypothetical protein